MLLKSWMHSIAANTTFVVYVTNGCCCYVATTFVVTDTIDDIGWHCCTIATFLLS